MVFCCVAGLAIVFVAGFATGFEVGCVFCVAFGTTATFSVVVCFAAVAVFAFVASTPHKDHLLYEIVRLYVGGISGMWMVFCFFRLSASWLQRIRLSKPLQYVGTRTLDIYLLHYFFLPRFLLSYADQLQAFDSSVVELVVILCISLLVLGVTLLASYIIRLSPFLGHYLFGVDYHK